MSYNFDLPRVHPAEFSKEKVAITFQKGENDYQVLSFDRDQGEKLPDNYTVEDDRFDPENLRALTIVYYESEDGTSTYSQTLRIPPACVDEFERIVREVDFDSAIG